VQAPVFSQILRGFDQIFPAIGAQTRNEVLSAGIVREIEKNGKLELLPSPMSGIDLPQRIAAKNFPYLTESLAVIPYQGKPLGILDAYNALGKIRGLKGRLYNSHTRGREVALFEDASRMESASKNNPIPDPPPAYSVPSFESIYIRLKDANFGNCYYRADITPSGRGLLCTITNYKTITYMLFSVMKEEKFAAHLYLEPLEEGMLIYSTGGTDVSDFISKQIDIPSAISKRIAVFIDWIADNAGTM